MTTQFKKSGEFVITNDGAFAICPEEYVGFVSFKQRDSIGLYIRDGLQLVDSPLKSLIDIGFIVSDGKVHKLKRRVGGLDETVKYNRYTFFRPLSDKRRYLGYRQPVENDTIVNENDCLKFAESLSVASDTLKKTVFTKLLRLIAVRVYIRPKMYRYCLVSRMLKTRACSLKLQLRTIRHFRQRVKRMQSSVENW